MNRREFITAAAAATLYGSASLADTRVRDRERLFALIAAVQRHFFPKGLHMPDADTFNAPSYLRDAVTHSSFDPDIRDLLFEGAERFDRFCDKEFVSMSEKQRENTLRKFEESDFGSYWLAQIMNLTLEALLADPIYGGNTNECGWMAFELTPGNPRPKERYCGV